LENKNKTAGTLPSDSSGDGDRGSRIRAPLEENIPVELKELSQWVGRRGKVPVDSKTGGNAMVSDSQDFEQAQQSKKARDTWGTIEEAVSRAERYGLDGVGFVFSEDDPYCGVDLDGCRDPETGDIEGWAQEIINDLDSYTEVSPSETGVHVIVRGVLPRSGKSGPIEMYDSKRYFTVTGKRLEGTPGAVRSAQQALMKLHRKTFGEFDGSGGPAPTPEDDSHVPKAIRKLDDGQLLRRILRSQHNLRFARLYYGGDTSMHEGDDSAADLALCGVLAYWSGGDRERMDSMFRKSNLMRTKWDEYRGERTYGELTIEKALEGKTESDFWNGPSLDAHQDGEAVVFTAAELEGMRFPEPRWAVEGVLAEGLSILGGRPKIGKSWLALALGAAIASGGTALGRIPTEAGDVLYLALEDNKRRLQERMRRIVQGGSWPERLHLTNAWPKTGAGGLDLLDEWCDAHPEARLVIVDTLARVRPIRSGRGDLYAEDYRIGQDLKALADSHGIAVLVVHHLRKMDSDDPLELLSGTLGLPGAADSVLVMKRERGKDDATLFVTGRDVEERELAVEWDESLWQWVHRGSAEEYRRSEARKEILELLEKEGEPLSPREIADGVGKKDTAVRQLLRSMVQDGEVLRHGTSSQTRYTLAEGDHDHHDDHGTHDHHGSTFSWEDEDSGTIIVNFSHLSGGHRAS
jgi:Fe2+ or Zn2+ uptake regulation protein